MRARYIGPNWDLAKVRGTRFNNGYGHRMAMDIGAASAGHWSGAHAVQWDMNAPPYGDIAIGDRFQKHNYPFGVILNARGERFLDEGLDFHSYTYAKYGHEVMKQPGLFAWQVFDQKIVGLLRDEYRIARITKETAGTLEELVRKLTGVDPVAALATIEAYNAAPAPGREVQSEYSRRAAHQRIADRQDQLGAETGYAALPCLWRHRRRHVHLRRPEGQHAGARSRTLPARRSAGCSRRERLSAVYTIITTAVARGWSPASRSAVSPAPVRPGVLRREYSRDRSARLFSLHRTVASPMGDRACVGGAGEARLGIGSVARFDQLR